MDTIYLLVPSVAVLSLAAWAWLALFRGMYWTSDQRPGGELPPERSPRVAAVVPARDEAGVVGPAVASLLAQDYPGEFDVVLVDDGSTDSTVAEAIEAAGAARASGGVERLTVVKAPERPAGWAGKVWAMKTGVEEVGDRFPGTKYILLTDADVVHSRANVWRLVAMAERRGLVLASLMVMLRTSGWWEGLLIPAFVYFFQMLYPMRWVNDPRRPTAAAAGGCMLARLDALEESGGLGAIRGEIIDDCSLARRLKPLGRVWLGLAATERSIRGYGGVSGVWRMVARTAYTQLSYSPVMLSGTVLGMALLYLVPPLALLSWPLHGSFLAATAGSAAWALMSATFLPTLALYERSPLYSPLLPLAGLLYTAMTVDSARRHRRGGGGEWKGRTYGERGEM